MHKAESVENKIFCMVMHGQGCFKAMVGPGQSMMLEPLLWFLQP
jgi:hypothetical protein